MATTIPQAFSKLKENLEISGLQAATVSTRQKNVRDVVTAGFTVLEDFLTGSYSRNTMIAPLSEADVDIFFVLDSRHYHHYSGQNGGPAGLLDVMKRTLLRTYTSTPDISRNGQAVTIRFTDFSVDVVPGFNRQGGGYLIPNSIQGNWISTNPRAHVDMVTAANGAHDGDFVPLVKMIKGWNRWHSRYFGSFHLEVLALEILRNVRISSFPSGVRFFFDKARELVTKQNADPAGYGGDVGSYLNSQNKINEAVQKLTLACERAIKAEAAEARGNIREAIDMWGKVFGDCFPAYG